MDWKLFLTTTGVVFLAELGDKTQIAALSLGAKHQGQVWMVWLGVTLGLVLAGTIGVLAGKWVGSALNPVLVTKLSGVVFIVLGLWTLLFSNPK